MHTLSDIMKHSAPVAPSEHTWFRAISGLAYKCQACGLVVGAMTIGGEVRLYNLSEDLQSVAPWKPYCGTKGIIYSVLTSQADPIHPSWLHKQPGDDEEKPKG